MWISLCLLNTSVDFFVYRSFLGVSVFISAYDHTEEMINLTTLDIQAVNAESDEKGMGCRIMWMCVTHNGELI